MNKIIKSPITKSLALIIGFAAALSTVRSFNKAYNYYIDKIIGNWLKTGLIVSIMLFVVCTAILCLSVWKSQGDSRYRIWRKADFSLLVVITFCTLFLCGYSAWYIHYTAELLPLSVTAYLIVMALLMELTARIRDRQLIQSLYWPRFFKLYPIWRPTGLLMALLLAGNMLYLFNVCFAATIRLLLSEPIFLFVQKYNVQDSYPVSYSNMNISTFIFSLFSLTALTYFCTFVLSLSAEYEKANSEKIRAERFKAELITNVSHDIRTPLTTIISYVDLLKALPVEQEDFTKYVTILDKKAARLKTLINDLMEASKAATGNMIVDMQQIDLSEIIGQIAGEFDDQLAERNLTFVFRQPDEQVLVNADSDHLWRVLENLFGNAAKYALPGTRVFAEIGIINGRTVLSLKNTSRNPIDLPTDSLTEQFIRGDRTRQSEGNGLGLYIAKSLMELMGGQFTVKAAGDLFEAEIRF